MNDEMEQKATEMDAPETEVAVGAVQGTIEKFLESATIDVVYGKPIKSGDTLIIPAAEILTGLGFGVAYGNAQRQASSGPDRSGGGGGGGGGGRVLSRPVAVVIASPQGVRVEPVVDVTKLGIAALTTFGFMLGFSMRMMRGLRRGR